MSVSTRLALGLLASVLLAPLMATAQLTEGVQSALNDLAQYKVGKSRVPLEVIADAVANAAEASPAHAALAGCLAALLEAQPSVDAGRFICRQLRHLAAPGTLPALEQVLTNPGLCDEAVLAVEALRGEAAVRALTSAVREGGIPCRDAAVRAIGRRTDLDSVKFLAELLDTGELAEIPAVIDALASAGGLEACEALLHARDRLSSDLGTRAAEACLLCAQNLQEAQGATQARRARLFEALASGQGPVEVRIAAMRALLDAKPRRGQSVVFDAISGDHPATALAAVGLATTLPGTRVTRRLTVLASQVAPDVHTALIEALYRRNDRSVLPVIRKAASAAAPGVQAIACKALGWIDDVDSVPLLADAAASAAPEVREAARNSLDMMRAGNANALLIQVAKTPGTKGRGEAIGALQRRDAVEAVPALYAISLDNDAGLQRTALAALGALAPADELPRLVALIEGEPASHDAIADAVVAVAARSTLEDGSAGAVIAALGDSSHKDILFSILARIGNRAALDAVRASLRAEDPHEHAAAAAALAAWPNCLAIGDLRALAANPKDDPERAMGYAGYLRLLAAPSSCDLETRERGYAEAITLAANGEEKRQALAGLATVPTMGALRLAQAQTSDAEVTEDARQAVVEIAGTIAGAYRDSVLDILRPIATATEGGAAREKANAVIEAITAFEDAITAWEVSGPYFEHGVSGAELFKYSYPPETSGEAEWRLLPTLPASLIPWAAPLAEVIGGSDRVAYLRSRVWSPKEQSALLEVGSNDGVKVWFNGELIHALNIPRGLNAWEDKLPVTLKSGWNDVMLGVYQHGGTWSACARMRNPLGKPLTGLRVSLASNTGA